VLLFFIIWVCLVSTCLSQNIYTIVSLIEESLILSERIVEDGLLVLSERRFRRLESLLLLVGSRLRHFHWRLVDRLLVLLLLLVVLLLVLVGGLLECRLVVVGLLESGLRV